MPDIARTYFQRQTCHEAYDALAEAVKAGGAVSAAERAWGTSYERATAGGKCPAPPASLAARATNRVVSTPEGLTHVSDYMKAGDPSAYFEAGTAALAGKVPGVSKADGVAAIARGAQLGDPSAQLLIGLLHAGGAFGKPNDYASALPLIEAAAVQGHVDALFQAANFYKEGLGTRKDPAKAFGYYRQAAERGHLYAALIAFYMIQDGEGVKKDFDLAYRIARNMADQGEAVGALLTASALLQQRNAKDKEDEVLYWMDVAIRDGDDKIQTELAKFRPQVVAAFKRANAPPEYHPRVRKQCPLKTVCLVDRFTGAQQSCTTNKDYWNDCDL